MNQHKKVTVDFSNYSYGTYDLAVPIFVPLKTLIPLIIDSLDLDIYNYKVQMKVMTKQQLLVGNDRLIDFQIANGDILKLL
ncbi:EsaB/YukD family protein [Staphylococcus gallinarum]|uniref:EsaB/YukD family protein n=1 Tax=Staphylococcus gallinarum TaxID=1293 RepID=UPI000D1D9B9D|nr:EsaB/YukD family protein [Staphylococcus gallinarum]PTL09535.1 type VII secretion protein EsaB [Staphylococcus gallinarum]RIO74312.1 type VII secretion protein EsaB [Staphylococcus gallinarum]